MFDRKTWLLIIVFFTLVILAGAVIIWARAERFSEEIGIESV